MTREYTNAILELIEEGVLSPQSVVEMCLNYMSEDDVADMYNMYDLREFNEPSEDE